jgi:uroporphyrinogen-III decarboxylase
MSGERTLYIGGFGIPSFQAGYTRWSYESYLAALSLYPDHFRRFFLIEAEKARLRNEAVREAVRRFGLAPFVYGGDDICFNDGPVCSLPMLDDLYFPALERAIGPLVEGGVDIVWHCDGNVAPLVPRLLSLGIGGFQGFQEREAGLPLATMASFRRRDGSPLILWGSVSVVHTFPHGSPEDVRREVERCFRTAGPRGFCLASSSSILPETPMENIEAFLEHGLRFGREFLGGAA